MGLTSGWYKIPRKRKYCAIVYHDKAFQSKDELLVYLKGEKNFSDTVAQKIIDSIREVSLDEIKVMLSELHLSKVRREEIISGVVVTKKKKKK